MVTELFQTEGVSIVATATTHSNNDKTKSVRRRTYRILSELPLEDWVLPDSCLQKTAEVRLLFLKKARGSA